MLADAIQRTRPALVIVDSIDFPACCQVALRTLPPECVIVVGPEPDLAYRARALALGAGGWVCRDHVGDELSAAMRAACRCHEPQSHRGGPAGRSARRRPDDLDAVGGRSRP